MDTSSQESPATPLSINRRGGAPFLQLLGRESRDRPAARQDQPPGSKRQPAVRAAVTISAAAGSSFHRVVGRSFRPGPAPCPWSRDRPAPAGQGRSLFMYNSYGPIFGPNIRPPGQALLPARAPCFRPGTLAGSRANRRHPCSSSGSGTAAGRPVVNRAPL